ncbi:helix-turn-helix transcriptional regulator [Massilia orientalis]|uniref:Helix-turn-helix transcriptional regulator n=1 Tax=Massilia orientalis TaxID=3050128 RepID=A0ACC7MIR3_9BURK|nr:AlpA family transcriptional regulator [Massilia sp. YIM B02787]
MTTQFPLKILRCKQVAERLSLSRSTIYDKLSPNSVRFDPSFPRPIHLGANAVGWVEAEIEHWLQSRIQDSRNGTPAS